VTDLLAAAAILGALALLLGLVCLAVAHLIGVIPSLLIAVVVCGGLWLARDRM
jgi:hypothetical protein